MFLSFCLSKNDTEVKTNDELIKKDIIFNWKAILAIIFIIKKWCKHKYGGCSSKASKTWLSQKHRLVFYHHFDNKYDYNVNTSKIHATSFIQILPIIVPLSFDFIRQYTICFIYLGNLDNAYFIAAMWKNSHK